MKALIGLILLGASAAASAAPLSIRAGESWAFQVRGGDPVKARKVSASAKPAKGEILISVRSFMGTMLTATNGTGRGWKFKAELMSGGRARTARACTLPKSRDPILEQWPGKTAQAVRVSRFVPADGGNC